jgi:hypothetical protein
MLLQDYAVPADSCFRERESMLQQVRSCKVVRIFTFFLSFSAIPGSCVNMRHRSVSTNFSMARTRKGLQQLQRVYDSCVCSVRASAVSATSFKVERILSGLACGLGAYPCLVNASQMRWLARLAGARITTLSTRSASRSTRGMPSNICDPCICMLR